MFIKCEKNIFLINLQLKLRSSEVIHTIASRVDFNKFKVLVCEKKYFMVQTIPCKAV